MRNGFRRPNTPAEVERLLRQEAGFGCAKCGHPYVEYHHIVPFSEEAHFRCEDMVALCGNCHPAVSKQRRDRQYEIKNNPFNISNGCAKGALEYDKRDLIFKVGGNWYENTPTIIQYRDIPIIQCHIAEGQAQVSVNLFGRDGIQVLSVLNNNISFRIDDVWDFKYAHNYVEVLHERRNVLLRMDFRTEEAKIEGSVWMGGNQIKLARDHTNLASNFLKGNRTRNCAIGIMVG